MTSANKPQKLSPSEEARQRKQKLQENPSLRPEPSGKLFVNKSQRAQKKN